MGATEFIRIREFCVNYGIEESFIFDLQEYEVIHIKLINDEPHLPEQELPVLEKMIRMHQELEINPQGLQAIYHLLEKVNGLQEELTSFKRRLQRLEGSSN